MTTARQHEIFLQLLRLTLRGFALVCIALPCFELYFAAQPGAAVHQRASHCCVVHCDPARLDPLELHLILNLTCLGSGTTQPNNLEGILCNTRWVLLVGDVRLFGG